MHYTVNPVYLYDTLFKANMRAPTQACTEQLSSSGDTT